MVAAFIDGADYMLIGAAEYCVSERGSRKCRRGTSGVVVADSDCGVLVAKEVEALLLCMISRVVVVIVEEHGPKVAPLGAFVGAGGCLWRLLFTVRAGSERSATGIVAQTIVVGHNGARKTLQKVYTLRDCYPGITERAINWGELSGDIVAVEGDVCHIAAVGNDVDVMAADV